MRLQDKIAINNMRLEGHTPSVIAATLKIPAGTVRSYIHRHPAMPDSRVCKQCGKPVRQAPHRREKKFCSDACRMAWWNSHQEDVNKKAFYTLTCACCGKEFESYGNQNRKYCCRACYIADRRAG
jgi:endogenous inhibitor of DNA gyrase (YacG/DUF329 family)